MRITLTCLKADDKARTTPGMPNVGVEYLGSCIGEARLDDGSVVANHASTTLDFLRSDLRHGVKRWVEMHGHREADFEIVDHIPEATVKERTYKNAKMNKLIIISKECSIPSESGRTIAGTGRCGVEFKRVVDEWDAE